MHYQKLLAILFLTLVPSCDRAPEASSPASTPDITPPTPSFADARIPFHTHITHPILTHYSLDLPPPSLFSIVNYRSPGGPLPAYLTPDPHDNAKHPAIIWIHGGDCNPIGDCWSPSPPDNDQSAAPYRNVGIIMLFPSLRGGNDDATSEESFCGEIDDVLAAADFLATQPYVDPKRIYLGGHSCGGTLALLTAEASSRFRAIFSFGPVEDIRAYGDFFHYPFDINNPEEFRFRNPINWLASITSPTFILEGDRRPSNISSLKTLAAKCPKYVPAHFLPIPNVTHFSSLTPTNTLIAKKILTDTDTTCNITFTPAELSQN